MAFLFLFQAAKILSFFKKKQKSASFFSKKIDRLRQ
jgi:hypothetical protein